MFNSILIWFHNKISLSGDRKRSCRGTEVNHQLIDDSRQSRRCISINQCIASETSGVQLIEEAASIAAQWTAWPQHLFNAKTLKTN